MNNNNINRGRIDFQSVRRCRGERRVEHTLVGRIMVEIPNDDNKSKIYVTNVFRFLFISLSYINHHYNKMHS